MNCWARISRPSGWGGRAGAPAPAASVPQGRPTIAHRFNGGYQDPKQYQAPEGAKEKASPVRSFVPDGTGFSFWPCRPAINRWAIIFRPPGLSCRGHAHPPAFVPQGRPTIAHRFNGGCQHPKQCQAPQGRKTRDKPSGPFRPRQDLLSAHVTQMSLRLQRVASSTIWISASVRPYNSYTSASICASVAVICREKASFSFGVFAAAKDLCS
jgi:hypothetical protein